MDSLEGTPTELRHAGSMPEAGFFFGCYDPCLFWSGRVGMLLFLPARMAGKTVFSIKTTIRIWR